MMNYTSPIAKINEYSFEDLSLKVAELTALLAAVTALSVVDNQSACMISAAERLTHWLQADVQALMLAYRRQHPATAKQCSTATDTALIENLQCQFESLWTAYHLPDAEEFVEELQLLGEIVNELHDRHQQNQGGAK